MSALGAVMSPRAKASCTWRHALRRSHRPPQVRETLVVTSRRRGHWIVTFVAYGPLSTFKTREAAITGAPKSSRGHRSEALDGVVESTDS